MGLSSKTIALVKSTASDIEQNAEAITIRMYEVLFNNYPETKFIFGNAASDQHKKLAALISNYAANIDNLIVFSDAVEKMATAHVNVDVQPQHYPMVGNSILMAIKDVLGDVASDEVLQAWREAYFFLADILIAREKELYSQK